MRPASDILRLLFPPAEEQPDLFPSGVEFSGFTGDHDLFQGGPPDGLQTRLGLMQPGRPNIGLRAAIAVAIGWLPLFVMSAVQSASLHDGSFPSFLTDYSLHARQLIAVPLLIAAEATCLPRLSFIARHFREAGLIAATDLAAFRRAVLTTRALRDSLRFELFLVALAVTIALALMLNVPAKFFPVWHRLNAIGPVHFSPAGWWNSTVSVWILMVLVFGWLGRLALWTRFLFLVSRLKLRLVAAHPDRAGGLRFVGSSVQAFWLPVFAFGAILAGSVANRVEHDGASLTSFDVVLGVFVALMVVMFTGPLLVFADRLVETWRRGCAEYGGLARNVGFQMERRWLNRAVDASALEVGDFSATTDLYAIVSQVYAMRFLPLGLMNFAVLIVASLLPFLPVALMLVSPAVILQKLTGLLL